MNIFLDQQEMEKDHLYRMIAKWNFSRKQKGVPGDCSPVDVQQECLLHLLKIDADKKGVNPVQPENDSLRREIRQRGFRNYNENLPS